MSLMGLGFKPRARKLIAFLAIFAFVFSFMGVVNPDTAYAKTGDSPAATEFVVNIDDGGIIIPVHTYTIEEMQELTSDEVVYYSSIDSMPAPNVTIAKGVTLSALVDDINANYGANVTISPTTLKSIKLYATDDWSTTYDYDYLLGATRHYYPELVNKWDSDFQKTEPGCDANPVEVEPIFATYSYQARNLTDLNPDQMLGPEDEGSTTFRFCFGQTADDIAKNTITNNRFGRWVNRIDIVLLPQYVAPELTVVNNKVDEDLVLTFEDNQTWRDAISDIEVRRVSIFSDTTKYSIEPGKITLDSSLFPQDGPYRIDIKARNFEVVTLWQQIDGFPSPVLSPDTTNCLLGQTEPVTISFEDDPAWREAIYDLTVRTLSKKGLYEVTPGAIIIQASAFSGAGKSAIVVKADKYKDAVVDQYMKLKPPVLTATPITVGEDATITFTDDSSWRTYIDTVTANGTKLIKATDYTVTTGKLTIKAAVFQEPGEYNIVITNRGNYVDAMVTQTVNAAGPVTTKVDYTATGDITAITPDTVTFADSKFTVPAGVTEFTFRDGNKEMKAIFADHTWTITETTTEPTTYDVIVDSAITSGTIEVNPASGSEGETITVTVTPDSGKRLVADSLKYTADGGGSYTAISTVEGVYSFILPAADVIVTAQFSALPAEDTPVYTVTPVEDTIYTTGKTKDGISTMTIKPDISGMKYFGIKVGAEIPHEGLETAVFTQWREDTQLSLNATRADFDYVDEAQAGFNVNPGDVVKAYIVDELINDEDHNPVVLQ